MAALTHSATVRGVYERALGASAASGRLVDVGGREVHLIEAGEGPALVLLHGSATSSLLLLPLLERLEGVRAIAVDRPGLGLSDRADWARERPRDAVVEWLNDVLDALALSETALAGNSMGGTWALWYALARPERVRRLVLLGAAPFLPGSRAPAPLRVLATPGIGSLLERLTKPSTKAVVRMMASMGEKETIVNYPAQIEALVAAGRDPLTSKANRAELRAAISPFGLRRSLMLQAPELSQLTVPTLLVWGDHDPVGTLDVAEATCELIPDCRLKLLPGGHGPWLGNPEQAAELVSDFVR
jgi:pimeloyl-ACP methyl ester carboxylesterase